MAATTDQKARLLDLMTGVLEMTRDGNRDIGEVCEVLQIVKEKRNFAELIMNAARQIRDFPVWKTVRLGTGLTTADDFRAALAKHGCKIGNWANDILGQPAFMASETATEADLVKVTIAELGFKEGARYDEICARAREFGLGLCPNEVGPQLRLQYPDQPLGEWLIVAMKPISDSDGDPGVWRVARDGHGLWLDARFGCPDDFWRADRTFVFVRPRK